MCRTADGELEQIQLLLGYASVQTTERYLGTNQDLVHAAIGKRRPSRRRCKHNTTGQGQLGVTNPICRFNSVMF